MSTGAQVLPPHSPVRLSIPQTAFCNISLQKVANPAKKRASTLGGRETGSYKITLEGHSMMLKLSWNKAPGVLNDQKCVFQQLLAVILLASVVEASKNGPNSQPLLWNNSAPSQK